MGFIPTDTAPHPPTPSVALVGEGVGAGGVCSDFLLHARKRCDATLRNQIARRDENTETDTTPARAWRQVFPQTLARVGSSAHNRVEFLPGALPIFVSPSVSSCACVSYYSASQLSIFTLRWARSEAPTGAVHHKPDHRQSSKHSGPMALWDDPGVLHLLCRHLQSVADLYRFSAVSKAWFVASKEPRPMTLEMGSRLRPFRKAAAV